MSISTRSSESIRLLADHDPQQRAKAANDLFIDGKGRILKSFEEWNKDGDFQDLVVKEQFVDEDGHRVYFPKLTVGIAVLPDTFDQIRAANGSPSLADAPSDQDVMEFELEFAGTVIPTPRLDVLTTNAPGGNGAIARFLNKFGEGIQQIEIDMSDVDRATEILLARFQIAPIYPATRAGANGTRVNFFLVAAADGKKVLVEFVEQPTS
jgi:hypothetical protein